MAKLEDLAYLILNGVHVRRSAWAPWVSMTFIRTPELDQGALRHGRLTLLTPSGPHRYLPFSLDSAANDWEVIADGTPTHKAPGRGL
jgi:hypothetical protein